MLDYKASKLISKRKNMNALNILHDVRRGQERFQIPKVKQISVSKDTDPTDVQNLLRHHCTGPPPLRQLLSVLAVIAALRKSDQLPALGQTRVVRMLVQSKRQMQAQSLQILHLEAVDWAC